MGLKNLIKSIPFVKNYLVKREIKNNQKATNEIKNVIQTIEEKSYTAKDLMKTVEIVKSISVTPECIEQIAMQHEVQFYSVSSQSGLEAIRNKCYGRETLFHTDYMLLQKTTRIYHHWFSNIESIKVMLGFHEVMLEKALCLELPPDKKEGNFRHMRIRQEEEIYLNSILYRLGLLDYLNLLLLLLEGKNEILKQQTDCSTG